MRVRKKMEKGRENGERVRKWRKGERKRDRETERERDKETERKRDQPPKGIIYDQGFPCSATLML